MGTYLVTGASSGLGLAVALALQQAGDTVLCMGRNKGRVLDAGLALAPEEWYQADFVEDSPQDITDTALAAAGAHKGLDGLVHCAGFAELTPLRLCRDDAYSMAMTFAESTFALLRAAARSGVMKPGGSVVVASSVSASRGCPGLVAYAASRAAAESMVRTAAAELAPRVRVNAVAFGAFESPLHSKLASTQTEAARKSYAARHPLGVGASKAAAATVLHLLSGASAWTTGTTAVVDGGYSLL